MHYIITITNGNIKKELNRKIVMNIPYFKTLLDGKYFDSNDETFILEYSDKTLIQFLECLTNKKTIITINNYSSEYIDLLFFLGMNKEIDDFSISLTKILATRTVIPIDIVEYCVSNTNLRQYITSKTIIESIYVDDKLQTLRSYPLCYYYFHCLHYVQNEDEIIKIAYDIYFRDEINNLKNNSEKYDLLLISRLKL